jgi:hypothetical protein
VTIFELLPHNPFEALTDNFSLRKHNRLFAMATKAGRIDNLTVLHGLSPHFVLHFPQLDDAIIRREELQGASQAVLFRTPLVEELHIIYFLLQLYRLEVVKLWLMRLDLSKVLIVEVARVLKGSTMPEDDNPASLVTDSQVISCAIKRY